MGNFDDIAKEYDKWYTTKAGAFADLIETQTAIGMLVINPGAKILDIGCGTGNFSIKLAELGYQVTGIDISKRMLEQAKRKAQAKSLDIQFHAMDVHNLEFPDNHFDGAVSMAAFEFIAKPDEAFIEMMRVLKPGGQILIGTINSESSWGQFYMDRGSQKDSIFRHSKFMNPNELKDLDRKNLMSFRECLFFSPLTPDKHISMEEEKRLSTVNKGGFICATWKKPV
ncbi:MAG: class I SAM-dependent methyltransferase [Firmicutes bacterium]|jgi:ubiquinone biosynthesis O-methyltransferase|nr:class I SAM-dependent methyltransferase [Bacillota bacterium]